MKISKNCNYGVIESRIRINYLYLSDHYLIRAGIEGINHTIIVSEEEERT